MSDADYPPDIYYTPGQDDGKNPGEGGFGAVPTQFTPQKPAGPDPVTPAPLAEGTDSPKHAQVYAYDTLSGNFQPVEWIAGAMSVSASIDASGITIGAVIVGGAAKGTTVAAEATSTPSGPNHQLIDVALYDASGNQLTATDFGAGEQHTADSGTDLYTPGTSIGTMSLGRVVASAPTLIAGRFSTYNLSTAGRMIVDGSEVTQPVSGTFWQATQPVSGTIAVSNFPATQPVSGTFWQSTQPVSGSITATATPDATQGTQTITAQDVASTSTAQFDNQNAITGVPTANSFATYALSSKTSLRVQSTGTWTGSISSEGSFDGGTTWYSLTMHVIGTSFQSGSFTSNVAGIVLVSGLTNYRIRATAAWTGTATITITETVHDGSTYVVNPIKIIDALTNTTATIKPASTASIATDTAVVTALSPNSPLPAGGNVLGGTFNVDGQKATYSACVTALTFQAAATDIFTIYGSASKTIRITKLVFSGSETAGSVQSLQLITRSAVNTGGTSAAATAVPHDSTNASATATVLSYTANPVVLGTEVGTVGSRRVLIGYASGANVTEQSGAVLIDSYARPAQAIVLRGVAQGLCLNLNGGTSAGNICSVEVEWTEE